MPTSRKEALVEEIVLADYDSRWPARFQREAERIRTALGDRALQIEHTGSTSVPSLVAKPIIDILLVVADSAEESTYLPDLEAAGYSLRFREINWYQHRLLSGPANDINLHILSAGCPEIDRVLMFRDRLRNDSSDRELYARTKLTLAQREWKHIQAYADAKTSVIEEILARASR